jgi:hypothetical protein
MAIVPVVVKKIFSADIKMPRGFPHGILKQDAKTALFV